MLMDNRSDSVGLYYSALQFTTFSNLLINGLAVKYAGTCAFGKEGGVRKLHPKF